MGDSDMVHPAGSYHKFSDFANGEVQTYERIHGGDQHADDGRMLETEFVFESFDFEHVIGEVLLRGALGDIVLGLRM
jgi:hypothetical protein